MDHFQVAVTSDAIASLQFISDQLDLQSQQLLAIRSDLSLAFEEHRDGLGPHSAHIKAALSECGDVSAQLHKALARLSRRIKIAANNRRTLLEHNPYDSEPPNAEQDYIPEVLGRIYDDLIRMRIKPHELGPQKEIRGRWEGNVFWIDDSYVPSRFNPNGLPFSDLRRELKANYGLDFQGIPFHDGSPDFCSLSVAQVNFQEIILANLKDNPSLQQDGKGISFETIFHNRSKNFRYADQICAKKQLPIPGLPPGYSAADLGHWRSVHHFTWDENFRSGYTLVPSVIHGNIPHSGLVAVITKGHQAEKAFAERYGGHIK